MGPRHGCLGLQSTELCRRSSDHSPARFSAWGCDILGLADSSDLIHSPPVSPWHNKPAYGEFREKNQTSSKAPGFISLGRVFPITLRVSVRDHFSLWRFSGTLGLKGQHNQPVR